MIAEPGETPTFPTIVLVGTLVTVVAPRTAKLAKSGPSIGAANAGDAQKMVPAKPTTWAHNGTNEWALGLFLGLSDVILMVTPLEKKKKKEKEHLHDIVKMFFGMSKIHA